MISVNALLMCDAIAFGEYLIFRMHDVLFLSDELMLLLFLLVTGHLCHVVVAVVDASSTVALGKHPCILNIRGKGLRDVLFCLALF